MELLENLSIAIYTRVNSGYRLPGQSTSYWLDVVAGITYTEIQARQQHSMLMNVILQSTSVSPAP